MRNLFTLLFYNLFIILPADIFLKTVGRFFKKLRQGMNVRRGWEQDLQRSIALLGTAPRALFHVASAGELQQALPVIRKLKEQYPDWHFGLSFFSVSGYSFFKGDAAVSFTCYSPFDTPKNAMYFMSVVKPRIYVVVAYDAWLNHVVASRNVGAKIVLLGGIFSSKSSRLKFPLRGITRETFNYFEKMFTIADGDKERLGELLGDSSRIEVVGEPRYDHILNGISNAAEKLAETSIPLWEESCVMTLGSIWPAGWEVVGEPVLELVAERKIKVFAAPHAMDESFFDKIQHQCEAKGIKVSRLSGLESSGEAEGFQVVVVDTVGLLSAIYSRSSIAYIGGAFGKGVHNVAEPAAFGMPLYFGSNYVHSLEARRAVESGAAVVVENTGSFRADLNNLIEDEMMYEHRSEKARDVIHTHAGATDKICKFLVKESLLV